MESTHLNRTAWPVVAASIIGLFFNYGSLLVVTNRMFIVPLSEQFSWTNIQVSLAFSMGTLGTLCGMLVVGRLADRFGARRLIIISMSLYGALFAALSLLTHHLWVLYLFLVILGLLGAGTSAVPHASLISRWFTTRRGLALGVILCATGIGGIVWPIVVHGLLDRFDWRISYALLGSAVLLIALPILLLFLKEALPQEASSIEGRTSGLGRREALLSGTFWLMMFVFILVSAIIESCMFYLEYLMTDRGISAQTAEFALSLLVPAGLIGCFVTGWLLDLFPAIRVVGITFAVVTLGIALLLVGVTSVSACLAAALIGFSDGAIMIAVPYLISLFFGIRSFGEIYSYLFFTTRLGSVLAPVLWWLGRTHSDRLSFSLFLVAMLVAAVLLLRLRVSTTFKE
jgi:MFS family permease